MGGASMAAVGPEAGTSSAIATTAKAATRVKNEGKMILFQRFARSRSLLKPEVIVGCVDNVPLPDEWEPAFIMTT